MKLVYILILALIIIIIILAIISFSKKTPFKNPLPVPQASNQATPSSLPSLEITDVYPKNNEKGVPLDIKIRAIFNQNINSSDFNIVITPKIDFTTEVVANTFFINPKLLLSKNSLYQINITSTKLTSPYNLSFTTSDRLTAGSQAPDLEYRQKVEQELKDQKPDFYLANKLPFQSTAFDIKEGSFKTQPQDHFSFVVTLKNPTTGKNDLTNWLKSLSFSDQQISNLEFIYLTNTQANLVKQFKQNAPFYADHSALLYNLSQDKTTVTIDKNNLQAGFSEVSQYLKQNSIDSLDWIDNLTININ